MNPPPIVEQPGASSTFIQVQRVQPSTADLKELTPCLGVGCLVASIYSEFPQCIGAVTSTALCCLTCQSVTCKPATEEDTYCKCCVFTCDCKPMTMLCSARHQVLCVDCRAALPPNEHAPCLLNFAFLTCAYKSGCVLRCCARIQDLEADVMVV